MTRSTTVAQAVEPPRGRGIVLITGFEPFGDLNHNPSAAVLDRLPSTIDGRPVVTEILPVATRSIKAAIDALPFGRADLVLLTGVEVWQLPSPEGSKLATLVRLSLTSNP